MNSLPPRPSFLPAPPQASTSGGSGPASGGHGPAAASLPPRLTHALPANPALGSVAGPSAAYPGQAYYGGGPAYMPAMPTGPVYSASGVNLAAFGGGYGAWAAGGVPAQQWAAYPGGGYPAYPPPQAAVPASAPVPAPMSSISQPEAGPSSMAPRPPRAKAPKLDMNRITSAPMRNCALSSCNFLGTVKDVEIHEMDRHLIYPPGYVERKKSRPDGPVSAIQFNRKLETDEQIAAWIQERKKKWPTAERAADKEKQREEALARGEIPRDGSNRGRGRGRGQDRGRGRGGRGGTRGGGGQGFQPNRDRPDGGYGAVGKGKERVGSRSVKVRKVGDGADDYDSDPLSSSDSSSSGTSSSGSSSTDTDDDDGPPPAQSVKRPRAPSSAGSEAAQSDADDGPPVELSTAALAPQASDRPPCVYFSRPRGCNLGAKCRFSHDVGPEPVLPPGANPHALAPSRLSKPVAPPAARTGSSRPSLMERLLEGEVRHTTSALAQVIRFLCDNDLLRGVEVRVGQAEDEARKGIEVVRVSELGDAPATEAGPSPPTVAESDGMEVDGSTVTSVIPAVEAML